MGKPLPKQIVTFIFIVLGFIQILGFSSELHAQNIPRRIETEISFPIDLHAPEVKFNLRSTGTKKFILILDEKSIQMTNVKIFDILGNLILEDKISPEDGTHKSYDFSSINSQLFVVEVGNAKYNKTKSVYANPQGQPTSNN
ncbi:hypothetical protein [Lunatibacter salilacus]|uniref:hypothetical protein n=1 Tax=Lunatibacter salilacus TaxID=2483804 RepID=UPI001F404366|nr:hypothetical protein [Lunatibacter salilacus]